ncbi:hypothetical protein H0H93_010621, partial [Arthromyces matolae]
MIHHRLALDVFKYLPATAKLPMSPNSHFPIELQDRVIAHLWEDHDTLAICSLVSSQWLELARNLLFSNLKLQLPLLYQIPAESAKYQEFKTLLQAPHSCLGPYIRQLELCGTKNNRPPITNAGMVEVIDLYHNFSLALLSILPLLTRVTDLTLQSIIWPNLSPEAREAIHSLSGVIYLKWIGCSSRVDDLILLSDGFPRLQTLQIMDFKETKPWSTLSQRPKSFEKLRILTFVGPEASMARLLNPVFFLPLSSITTLALTIFDYTGGKDVASILRGLGPTLNNFSFKIFANNSPTKEVKIDKGSRKFSLDFTISLTSNINLKTLTFTPLSNSDMWWLNLLLKTVSDEHNLEEIRFSVGQFDKRSPLGMEDIILRVVKPQTKVICDIGWLSGMSAGTL